MSLAHTLKLPVETLRITLLILIAVTIVASLQAVGIALMLALLITPAATARLLFKRLPSMIVASAIIGISSGIVGFYVSYYLDVPSGASIVLTMSSVFAVVFILTSLWDMVRANTQTVQTA
ncbi:MAG: metal ABC transporter permease, partial [Chloroflexota bacterium]